MSNTTTAIELYGAIDEAAEHGDPLFVREIVTETLKSSAGMHIFCPIGGKILDYRTVVVISSFQGDVQKSCNAVHQDVWLDRGPAVVESITEMGGVVKILHHSLLPR